MCFRWSRAQELKIFIETEQFREDVDASERVNPKFGPIDICLHGLSLTAKLFRKRCNSCGCIDEITS